MTTQFMRNYIDLINEMEQPQPQQLDEGMMDTLKGKVKSVVDKVAGNSALAPYYKKAQTHSMDVIKAIQSSRSGDELMGKLKTIAGASTATNEIWDPKANILGASAAGIISVATGIFNYIIGTGGKVMDMIRSVPPEKYQGWLQTPSEYYSGMTGPEMQVARDQLGQYLNTQAAGAGSILMLMIPLCYAVMAYLQYQEAKEKIKYNKELYPDRNPVSGKPKEK